ncbi:MAG: DUF4097 family beta strand repeat-containing protein [Nitrospirota bacterium]
MKNTYGLLLLAGSFAFCQETGNAPGNTPDRVTVPFSDASRPRMVKCSLLNGAITVKGYAGKDVIVEARPRNEERRHRRSSDRGERTEGMRRIDVNATGLSVEESDNVVVVGTRAHQESIDVTIQVPFATSLKLHGTNGGDIIVDHVSGEIEIDNINGNAIATHISGSAVLHSLNGKVLASLDKITGDKAMSFSTLNGDIDVTLPADTKVKVKMKSDNGEIYSDFDVRLDASGRQPVVEDNRSGKGKYRVRFEKAMYGTINGGGPEMQLTTFNGNVYIRKAK